MSEQKPYAYLYQHGETGRTRIVEVRAVADCDARWLLVGPLFLGAAPPAQPACGLSWGGHNITGDKASIAAAKAAITCEADWRKHLESVAAQLAPAQRIPRWTPERGWHYEVDASAAQPAPAQQEPVAATIWHRYSTEKECADGLEALLTDYGKTLPLDTALYAAQPAPAQPTALSDDDIVDIWAGVSSGYDDTINIIELGRAIEAAIVPEGWIVVPVEPTKEFVNRTSNYGIWSAQEIRNLYAAMIAAAKGLT